MVKQLGHRYPPGILCLLYPYTILFGPQEI